MRLRTVTRRSSLGFILLDCAGLPVSAQDTAAADPVRSAWARLEAETLPQIDKLSAADPCGNQAASTARLEETRAAAKKYFSGKGKELQQSHETATRDLD